MVKQYYFILFTLPTNYISQYKLPRIFKILPYANNNCFTGKYAQVLQSTSRIYQEGSKPKPTPSNSGQPRILKTAAPHLQQQIKQQKHHQVNSEHSATGPDGALPLEALFQGSQGI